MLSKIKNAPDSVKSAVAFTISSLFIRGVAFVTTPVFTRIMTTDQYGVVSTYNSWQTILEVFALLGLTSAGVFNVGLNDYRNNRDKYMSSVLILSNTATIVSFIVVLVISIIFGNDIIMPISYLIIMYVQFFFSPAQIFWITRQRYEYKYKLATVISVFSVLLIQVIGIFCVKAAGPENSAFAKVVSTGFVSLLFYIPFYILLIKRGKTGFDRAIWKETLLFALPLLPHYLAQHVMLGADRIMISRITSTSDAAIYSVVSAISLIATIVWSAANASLTPFIYDKLNNNKNEAINGVVFPILSAYSIMCVFVTLIAPEVLFVLAPKEYAYGIYAVPPIAGVAFLNALYNTYASIEFYHKKSKTIATATIIACIINISLNALAIPIFGFVAAAYTTLISNIVLILVHYRGYRSCQEKPIFADKSILVLSLACIGLCEACVLLYQNTFVRYGFIVFLITLAIIFRKKIAELYYITRKQ